MSDILIALLTGLSAGLLFIGGVILCDLAQDVLIEGDRARDSRHSGSELE